MCRINSSCLFQNFTVVFLLVLVGSATASAKVIYVDADAPGIDDGTNWENAYNFLQDALADAEFSAKPVEIKVAQGIYRPDETATTPSGTGDRYYGTFQLLNGVILKGGYAGNGQPEPDERDITVYETILSGDLNANDIEVNDPCDLDDEPTRSDNSFSVLVGSDTNETAVLDGFTITGGHANGSSPDYGYLASSGAGIYNNGGSPKVINCTFSVNWARRSGGGMSNHYGSGPTVTNCTFSKNRALHSAGGMYNHEGSSPTVTDCGFFDNSTDWAGGAMENYLNSPPIVTNCTFRANYSTGRNWPFYGIGGAMVNTDGYSTITGCSFIANFADEGGGVINWGASTNTIFIKCTFSRNKAIKGGGMFNEVGSSTTLINCTFKANTSIDHGGGMLNMGNSSITNCTFTGNRAGVGGGILTGSIMLLSNCILWNDSPEEIYMAGIDTPVITYSNVQGGWPGQDNMDKDPCFVNPGYWDANGTPEDVNDDTWIDGDYHLKSQAGRYDPTTQSWVYDDITSPCIDAGDIMSPVGLEPFPNGGIINMGAYGAATEASKSYFGKPPCEIIVAGDVNGDCVVNFLDFRLMAMHWCEDNNP